MFASRKLITVTQQKRTLSRNGGRPFKDLAYDRAAELQAKPMAQG